MKPVSRVNPATEENKEQDRNNTSSERETSRGDSSRSSSKQGQESNKNQGQSQGQEFGRDTKERKSSDSPFNTEAIGSAFNEFAGRAQEVASNVMEKAQHYGSDVVEQSGTLIRKYPAQSLLAGFGIGLILGLTLSRR